ncbi:RNA methyltransferase [Robiginitalea sp. SC105]|uniref:TrmH family RNA methyltransferase n=1 Tax=Robiginitalea sp. SC105 TaxID=2762332 RepID=UPI00163AF375|nr:RNA methyltransferase [Robiginitalea sp. SC105]MBC2839469.1 RNA methyltransferase [Robiginitalea sp. SC105]
MDIDLLEYLEGFLTEARRNRFLEVLSCRTRHITVALEDVYQLHNASAVIRSCDIFGIQDAHLIEARFGSRLDKKIAMGAQRWVDIHRYDSTRACVHTLREKGYRIVVTSPREGSATPESLSLDQPVALFFGTEKEGLSDALLQQADEAIHIPMVGFTESLNVSVAAAIILRQLATRLRASGIPWQLTEPEILEKRLDWTKKTIKSAPDIIARYRKST